MSACSYQPPTEYQQAWELADQQAWDAMTPEQQEAQVAEQIATRRSAQSHVGERIAAMVAATPRAVLDAATKPNKRLIDAGWECQFDYETGLPKYRLSDKWYDEKTTLRLQGAREGIVPPKAMDQKKLSEIHELAHDQSDPRIFKGTPAEFFAKAVESVAPELREWRIEYYTMSDGHATATVRAENELAARKMVAARPDCDQVIGGVR